MQHFVWHQIFGIAYMNFSVDKKNRLQGKIIIIARWFIFKLYLAHRSEQDEKNKTMCILNILYLLYCFLFLITKVNYCLISIIL